jgi:multiple sugar transport system substrate-binding protein
MVILRHFKQLFPSDLKRDVGWKLCRVILYCSLTLLSFGCDNAVPQNSVATNTPISIGEQDANILAIPHEASLTLAVETANLEIYRRVIDQFEAANPSIAVRVVALEQATPSGSYDVGELARVADVFTYYPYLTTETNVLLDISPLLESEDVSDFHPGLLPSEGTVYGLPTSVEYHLMFYAKEAFDEAGLAYPENDWTLDEFVTLATKLTRSEGDEVIRWGFIADQLRYSPLLATQLERPLLQGGELRLNDPDVQDAIAWMSDLFVQHGVSPFLEFYRNDRTHESDEYNLQNPYDLIENGKAAMWQRLHTSYAYEANIGVVAMPHEQGMYAVDPIQKGFAISKGTQDRDAAWKLLQFLTMQPPLEFLDTMNVPARRSVAEAIQFWDGLPQAIKEPLLYAVNNTTTNRIDQSGAEALLMLLTVAITTGQLPDPGTLVQEPQLTLTPTVEPFVVPTAVVPQTNAGASVIRFLSSTNRQSQEALAEEYMRQYPEVIIEFVDRELGLHASTLDHQIRALEIDCFLSEGGVPDTEVAASLSPFFELDQELSVDDFYQPILNAFRIDDELYAIPGTLNLPYLYYNQELFAELGLTEPTIDWTVENLLAMLVEATSQEDERYGYVEQFPFLFSFSRSMLGEEYVITDPNQRPSYNFAGNERALRWSFDLVRTYGVQMEVPRFGGEEYIRVINQKINDGEILFWPYFLGHSFDSLELEVEVPIGVITIPFTHGVAGLNIPDRSTSYQIAAQSSQKSACWGWIKFLAQHPSQAADQNWMPIHIAASQADGYIERVGLPLAELFQLFASHPDAVSTSADTPPAWFAPITVWGREAYQDAIASGNVDNSIVVWREQYDAYYECVQLVNGFDEYDLWRECALSIDPELSNFLKESIDSD